MPEPLPEESAARGDSLLARILRPSRSQLIFALVLCLVTAATVIQIRVTRTTNNYVSLRRTDLVQMLDGLQAESRRQQAEIEALQTTRAQLQSGADSARVAQEQAQQRLDEAALLAGTVAATGPGITMVVTAPVGKVTPDMVLGGIQELRDAGAEAIEFNNSVRLVAQSWVGHQGDDLVVDGVMLSLPLTIDAIGDPHSLEEGAQFRGGIVSQLESDKVGGTVIITRSNAIRITALHSPQPAKYAKPA